MHPLCAQTDTYTSPTGYRRRLEVSSVVNACLLVIKYLHCVSESHERCVCVRALLSEILDRSPIQRTHMKMMGCLFRQTYIRHRLCKNNTGQIPCVSMCAHTRTYTHIYTPGPSFVIIVVRPAAWMFSGFPCPLGFHCLITRLAHASHIDRTSVHIGLEKSASADSESSPSSLWTGEQLHH